MPILSGSLTTVPPEKPLSSVQPVYSEFYGTMQATWVDAYGGELPLSDVAEDSPLFTMDGPAGWGAPPIELATDPLPRGGEQVRFIRELPRRMQWPLYIGGQPTFQAFTEQYRRIVESITSTDSGSPGFMRVAMPDGTYRQIACYYEDGLGGESGQNHTVAKPVVTLFCPDGFWWADRQIVARRDFLPADEHGYGGSFFKPFMSLRPSHTSTGGPDDPEMPVFNPGSVEAWPVWTITGPMAKLTAANRAAGTSFVLTYPLPAGQTITITTNRPTVRGPGQVNLSKYLDWFNPAGTELWPVMRGSNPIHFEVDGAGPGTSVEMVFTPRHKTY